MFKKPDIKDLWFSPADIRRYTEMQIDWLLYNYDTISGGQWPAEPRREVIGRAPGYAETAPYQAALDVISELDKRLDCCDQDDYVDGHLVRAHKQYGVPLSLLAVLMGKDEERIERRVERAIEYCSGAAQRVVSYAEFCGKRTMPETWRPMVPLDRHFMEGSASEIMRRTSGQATRIHE